MKEDKKFSSFCPANSMTLQMPWAVCAQSTVKVDGGNKAFRSPRGGWEGGEEEEAAAAGILCLECSHCHIVLLRAVHSQIVSISWVYKAPAPGTVSTWAFFSSIAVSRTP